MIKSLLVLGAAAIAAPAFASDARSIEFVRDGHHYVGTVQVEARGQHLEGYDVTTGDAFDLVVAKGEVTGLYDGVAVDFAAPLGSTQTASR